MDNEERKWCVYMHTNKINGKKYIGITCQKPEYRWNNGQGYHDTYFGNAIEKYGWDNFIHEIIKEELSQEEACKLEITLIENLETTNRSKGYNISTGGEKSAAGTTHITSEETKRKISEAQKGKLVPEERRKRISESVKKYFQNNPKITSEETKLKISKANKGKPGMRGPDNPMYGKHSSPLAGRQNMPVVCIETNEIFDSCNEAGRAYNIAGSGIRNAATGKTKTCCGLHWKKYERSEDYGDA